MEILLYGLYFDSFFTYQTAKVRVVDILKNGVEVTTRLNDRKLGFIPSCYLDSTNLYDGKSLYVTYLMQDSNYFYFAEDTITIEKIPDDIMQHNNAWLIEQEFKRAFEIFDLYNDLFPYASSKSRTILWDVFSEYDSQKINDEMLKLNNYYTKDLEYILILKSNLEKEKINELDFLNELNY